MDRSTKATLSTYNTWIQLSRLQKIYHFQSPKLRFATIAFNSRCDLNGTGQAYFLSCGNGDGEQRCLASMDSDLEAFSRNPADGSFAVLASQDKKLTLESW